MYYEAQPRRKADPVARRLTPPSPLLRHLNRLSVRARTEQARGRSDELSPQQMEEFTELSALGPRSWLR